MIAPGAADRKEPDEPPPARVGDANGDDTDEPARWLAGRGTVVCIVLILSGLVEGDIE
jgi:hypothetical protein